MNTTIVLDSWNVLKRRISILFTDYRFNKRIPLKYLGCFPINTVLPRREYCRSVVWKPLKFSEQIIVRFLLSSLNVILTHLLKLKFLTFRHDYISYTYNLLSCIDKSWKHEKKKKTSSDRSSLPGASICIVPLSQPFLFLELLYFDVCDWEHAWSVSHTYVT